MKGSVCAGPRLQASSRPSMKADVPLYVPHSIAIIIIHVFNHRGRKIIRRRIRLVNKENDGIPYCSNFIVLVIVVLDIITRPSMKVDPPRRPFS